MGLGMAEGDSVSGGLHPRLLTYRPCRGFRISQYGKRLRTFGVLEVAGDDQGLQFSGTDFDFDFGSNFNVGFDHAEAEGALGMGVL